MTLALNRKAILSFALVALAALTVIATMQMTGGDDSSAVQRVTDMYRYTGYRNLFG